MSVLWGAVPSSHDEGVYAKEKRRDYGRETDRLVKSNTASIFVTKMAYIVSTCTGNLDKSYDGGTKSYAQNKIVELV